MGLVFRVLAGSRATAHRVAGVGLLFLMAAALLSACGDEPRSTTMAAVTITPAKVPVDTAIPEPTSTLVPLSTNTPSLTPRSATGPSTVSILKPPATPTHVSRPVAVPHECPLAISSAVDAECAYLIVPGNYNDPSAGELELEVVIFRSPNPLAADDPVVFLDGGPGAHSLELLPFTFDLTVAPLLQDRDVIVFDQRGTGFSRPSLYCPELADLTLDLLDEHLTLTEELGLTLDAVQECRDRLAGEGIDLAWFNTAASAADVDRLRAALGYEQWNLFGVSYGTRLAQTVMRDFPGGVRRVVLDSAYPLDEDFYGETPANAERALRLVIDSCAADQTCNANYPDLGAALAQAYETLNDAPAPVTMFVGTDNDTRLRTSEAYDTLITGPRLADVLLTALYDASLVPLLPEIISEAAVGNMEAVNFILSGNLASLGLFSFGMHHSVQCQDEIPFTSEEVVARRAEASPLFKPLMDRYVRGQFPICAIWDVPPSAPIENIAVSSDITTLVLAGEFDPVTPPSAGRAVAANLSQSTFIEFPGISHGVVGSGPCAAAVIGVFLAAKELDIACVDDLTGPQWVLPVAQTTLVPYEDPLTGLKGVVPEGWRELISGVGVVVRSDIGLPFFTQGFASGVSADTVFDYATEQLGEALSMEQIGRIPAGGGEVWTLFQGEAFGRTTVIATADFDSGAGFVFVGGFSSQRDALLNTLLLPALAAFEPPR